MKRFFCCAKHLSLFFWYLHLFFSHFLLRFLAYIFPFAFVIFPVLLFVLFNVVHFIFLFFLPKVCPDCHCSILFEFNQLHSCLQIFFVLGEYLFFLLLFLTLSCYCKGNLWLNNTLQFSKHNISGVVLYIRPCHCFSIYLILKPSKHILISCIIALEFLFHKRWKNCFIIYLFHIFVYTYIHMHHQF